MKSTLATLLLAASCALASCHAPHPVTAIDSVPQASSGPHIVVVLADDQGWGDVGYNGHPVLQTPQLDEASAKGLRFDRFYAAAPVCSPTRASVLTGRHPNRIGVFKWGYPMRPQETTLAEALEARGYATAHFGKWHLGSVRRSSPAHPGKNGFDDWLSAPNFFDNDPILCREGQAVPCKGESSVLVVDETLAWMRERLADGAPLFAFVCFGSPHSPHRAAEEDRAVYEGLSAKLQNFYGEITGIDRAFGALRRGLDELGIRENTVLWYLSDNGALPRVGNTGGHRAHKGKVYDGGLLVPSFVEWPARIRKARRTNLRCNTSDLYPTMLELAGGEIDDRVRDGRSLAALFDGEELAAQPMGFWDRRAKGIRCASDERMKALLEAQREGRELEPDEVSLRAAALPEEPHSLEHFPGHAAWIDEGWKLHRIENAKGLRFELYDLERDPKEERDRHADEGERATRMRAALEAWLRSVVRSYNGADYGGR